MVPIRRHPRTPPSQSARRPSPRDTVCCTRDQAGQLRLWQGPRSVPYRSESAGAGRAGRSGWGGRGGGRGWRRHGKPGTAGRRSAASPTSPSDSDFRQRQDSTRLPAAEIAGPRPNRRVGPKRARNLNWWDSDAEIIWLRPAGASMARRAKV
jgi:hypothetical protein